MAESFFASIKRERERIGRRTSKSREDARQDVFDYIKRFHNPVRKHVRNAMLSPLEFERQPILKAEGVQKSRGYSTRDNPNLKITQRARGHRNTKALSC